VEDDAGGGPSWAQSKNRLEDLMGHTAEKPPGLAKWNTSSENKIPPLKTKYLLWKWNNWVETRTTNEILLFENFHNSNKWIIERKILNTI
jgi:hypothetical protein